MKYVFCFAFITCSFIAQAQNVVTSGNLVIADPLKKTYTVEASCGQCNFSLPGKGCDLAIRMDGKAYYVSGTDIDSHGDAHARDGFCETIRTAEVQGEVVNDKFEVSYFKLNEEPMENVFDAIENTEKEISTVTINGNILQYGESELLLSRGEISIEFDIFPYNSDNLQWHAAKIAATIDKSDLKYFEEGIITNSNPFYSYTGTGIAAEQNKPYECMYVDSTGHHFIYYESDTDKRADVIAKMSDGKVRLRWKTDCFTIYKNEVKIKNSEIKELYLMIFIDENLNKTIEENEYNRVTIKFE